MRISDWSSDVCSSDLETWLYGVRNPWRFSFDRANGDLWVADVGQNEWEEINHLPTVGGFDAGRGTNLGWSEMEGTHPFEGGTHPPKAILPIYEYGRSAEHTSELQSLMRTSFAVLCL